MFNCAKCWESPCVCGHEYKHKTDEQMADFIYGIVQNHNIENIIKILRERSSVGRTLGC